MKMFEGGGRIGFILEEIDPSIMSTIINEINEPLKP